MDPDTDAPPPQAALRWNAGGWFGGQLGATAWMLVAAALTAARDLQAGLLALGLWAVPNAVGLWLWRRRPWSCYASTQALVAVAGACGLLCVFVLDRAGVWTGIQVGSEVSAPATYAVIALTFGGLMLVFHLRFGRGSGTAGG